jgi:hypothetical protein
MFCSSNFSGSVGYGFVFIPEALAFQFSVKLIVATGLQNAVAAAAATTNSLPKCLFEHRALPKVN